MASEPPQKPLINLLRGWPQPSLLPADSLKAASSAVLSDPSIFVPGLQYGDDAGFLPLREELSKWLAKFYSVEPDASRICITGGASQNLAAILQSFTDPAYTRAVWMVAPCYHLACPIFADSGFGGRLKAVPEDEEGINIEYLERGLESMKDEPEGHVYKDPVGRKLYRHIVYLVPTCANPSGKTLPVPRREALVKVARKHDALVICDDVYDCLQWPTSQSSDSSPLPPVKPLPRLCDIDRALGPSEHDPEHFGHAVSNGSFSKIVAPGMRTGWVDATPAFAAGLAWTGSTKSGGAPSQFCAAVMHQLLITGELDRQIHEVYRPALHRKHRLLMDCIHKNLTPYIEGTRETSLTGSDTYGGYFVWFSLKSSGPKAKAVAERAKRRENIVIGNGGIFEVHGDEDAARFTYQVRLCYSWLSEEEIVEGTERLARALESMAGEDIAGEENDTGPSGLGGFV